MKILATPVCFALLMLDSTMLHAQEAEEALETPQDYGFALVPDFPDYSGEEIEIADGRIISYRQTDPYDEFELAAGANATFVDMKSGKTRLVVPKDSDQMVHYLNVVYSADDPPVGVGYVARVGTEKSYANGRVDVIVGRFSDLEQRTLFSNVRYLDSPTHVSGDLLSMILWPEGTQAKYTVVDVATFKVIKSEDIDLPKPVEIIRKPCPCDESGYGERLETYSPLGNEEGGG